MLAPPRPACGGEGHWGDHDGEAQFMMSCNRAIAFAALLLASINASATNFAVTRTDDPFPNGCQANDCSLREAVITANALSGTDRIILAAGIYHLTLAGNGSDNSNAGDLDVDSDIEIVGAGAASTTILGENSSRIFDVGVGGSLLLRRLTLDHGRDDSGDGGDGGGAILQNGALAIEDAVISGSQTTFVGGAIYNISGSETVLRRVQLLNNSADLGGGAFSGNSGVLLVDSIVSGNSGGAFDGGGGIHGCARVYRSLIQNNHTTGDGGGIRAEGCSGISMEVHESTIASNTAVNGGGFYALYPFVVELSTFSGNAASGAGGGIYIDDGEPSGSTAKVLSSTLYLNTALDGSAVLFNDSQYTPNFLITFQNTLVSGTCERFGAGANYIDGVLGNLQSPGHGCGFGGPFPNGTFSTYDVPAENLKLGALGNNGGPTPTHLPQAGSAAIGTGWQLACEKLDQRGYVRTGCDVGAAEAGALNDVIFRTGNDY
jgi:hypothetical protein